MSTLLKNIWDNLEEYLCAFLLMVIVTLLMAQVVFRYGSGKTVAWIEEVSRFAFLYLVYLAASGVAAKNLHIRVTAQLKLLPRFLQVFLLFATDLIWLIFCVITATVGYDFIVGMTNRPMISGSLMLDMRYVYFSVPFAFTLQGIRLVERWWKILTKREVLVIPSEEVF
ncbi:MAG: TRAP transporter small permease [Desulfovibrio sp.]|jgi:TRAP-type C4-dicarboxylate transport system permease small subunit|nr:TRAP transporter small permease [Desulfovibrio sp.]